MTTFLADIFFDRHHEIRPVWRILIFITLLLAISFALLSPLIVLRGAGKLLQLLAMVLAVIAASAVMTRFVHRKPFGAFGLGIHPSTAREFLRGLLIGGAMMAGIVVLEFASGMVTMSVRVGSAGDAGRLVVLAGAEFLLAAALEELLFRGYLFQVLIQWITLLPALVVMALLFALVHGGNPGIGALAYVNIALVSVTLSFAYYRTRGLWLPIGIHFGWNFAQTTLFGLPTSGLAPGPLALVDTVQRGPDWLTGAGFGPEAGLLATLSIVAGTWYVLKSRTITPEEGIITLDSIEDIVSAGGGREGG